MADSWRHSSRPPGNAIAPALGGIGLRSRISLTEAALAILMVGFFVAGVFGRFPWKADEPYSFGIVWKMLQTGDWLVPRVADQPFVEKPPLVYWLGALSARTMPGVPAHEASRVAVLMLGAVTLLSIVVAAARLWPEASRWRSSLALGRPERGRDGREWNRRDYAWLAVALAVGTLGWVEQVHKFTADLGQMAGAALALTGLVCISTRFCLTCLPGSAATWRAGLMLGTGVGVAFLSKGLLVPGIVFLTWLACLSMPTFRDRQARIAAGVALATATPWIVVWPALLYARSPELFDEWFWTHNLGRFVGTTQLGGNHVPLWDRLSSLALASFPAGWLAVAVVGISLRHRRKAQMTSWSVATDAPGHLVVAGFLGISLLVLTVSACFRDNYILPLLPPFVLLGLPAALLATGRRSRSVGWGLNLLFGMAFAVPLLLWFSLVATGGMGIFPTLSEAVGRMLPLPFEMRLSEMNLAMVVATLLAWRFAVKRGSLRHPVLSWSAGVATLWILTSLLLLPWIDAARSYEHVFAEVGEQVVGNSCVATADLGESQLAMLDYVTGLAVTRENLGHSGSGDPAQPNPAAAACAWTLVRSRGQEEPHIPDGAAWRLVWRGSRPADANEHFALFHRSIDPWP